MGDGLLGSWTVFAAIAACITCAIGIIVVIVKMTATIIGLRDDVKSLTKSMEEHDIEREKLENNLDKLRDKVGDFGAEVKVLSEQTKSISVSLMLKIDGALQDIANLRHDIRNLRREIPPTSN